MIISRLEGDRLKDRIYRQRIEAEAKKGIGGFVVFGGEKNTVSKFIQHVKGVVGEEILFAADVERGLGSVIKDGAYFPSQMAVCAAIKGGIERTILEDGLRILAEGIRQCGIDMALIPVLDVNREKKNPIIGTRAFSDDPVTVADLGCLYIEVLQREGILCCAKHFPGHGLTLVDSHKGLPIVEKSDFFEMDLWPFRKAIEGGVSAVMVGHLLFPFLDKKPASLSKKIVGGLLRAEMGFEGVVMTDALTMGALSGERNVSVNALMAGIDILLLPSDPEASKKEIMRAIVEKMLSEEDIAEKVGRLKSLWRKKGGEERRGKPLKGDTTRQLTEASITLVKGMFRPVSVTEYSLALFGIKAMCEASPLRRVFKEWKQEKKTLIAIFTENSSISEHTDLDGEQIRRIKDMIRRSEHVILVSFGSPYVLSHFQEAHVLIAAYDTNELVQHALLRTLRGEIEFKGMLPVSLK